MEKQFELKWLTGGLGYIKSLYNDRKILQFFYVLGNRFKMLLSIIRKHLLYFFFVTE